MFLFFRGTIGFSGDILDEPRVLNFFYKFNYKLNCFTEKSSLY
jgi:hypothetical protein